DTIPLQMLVLHIHNRHPNNWLYLLVPSSLLQFEPCSLFLNECYAATSLAPLRIFTVSYSRYPSTARITSCAVIISKHCGNTVPEESVLGLRHKLSSFLSPSSNRTTRDFQQPPLSQHGSMPNVCKY